MKPKIGFIGLGIMGMPMARNLLGAGHELAVFNRTSAKTRHLKELGAQEADDPAELASWADMVILMLSDEDAVDAVLDGPQGLLAGALDGKVLVNMGTVSPAYSRALDQRLARRTITLLDAPVSDFKKPAEEGNLIILAGGPPVVIKQLTPVLLAMGKKVVNCGPAGSGSAMKMAINLLLGIMMAGFSEAAHLAQSCGLAQEDFLDIIYSGPLNNGLFQMKREMILTGDYPPQFPLKHMTKDLRLALQTAADAETDIPVGRSVLALYRDAMNKGWGEEDFTCVKRILQDSKA